MFSSVKIDDRSRSTAAIVDKESKKIQEIIYINDRTEEDQVQHESLKETIEKYGLKDDKYKIEEVDGIIQGFKLSKEYEFHIIPADFNEFKERVTSFVVGKSGSGKSYQIAMFLKYYHHMYPDNIIYWISCKDIRSDKSFSELVKKKSFKKM